MYFLGLEFNNFKPAHFYKPMFDKINFINTKNTTNKKKKIFNGGYLGSHSDEERSEVR